MPLLTVSKAVQRGRIRVFARLILVPKPYVWHPCFSVWDRVNEVDHVMWSVKNSMLYANLGYP